MKKNAWIAVFAGVAISAWVAYAEDMTAVSGNVVGFINVEIPPEGKFAMVGYNFKPINGDTIGIKELFGDQVVQHDNLPTLATKVYIWDPSLGNGGEYAIFFQKTDGEFYNIQARTTPTNPVVRAGQAFWIQSPMNAVEPTIITFVGEVVADDQFAVNIPEGFLMIANPYSAPLDLNSDDLDWIADGATGIGSNVATLADNIYIWNGQAYGRYFLKSTGKWHVAAPPYDQADEGVAVIPVGGAAWYKARGSFQKTLIRPYPWAE